jgi:hypothetical protein
LLLAVVLAGWSAFALLPVVGRRLGIVNHDPWFIDSYAVLAASDAVRAGIDPFGSNPLDIYNRAHSYSSWWFHLGDLGLTRQDNFLLGGSWVALFLAAGLLLLRPPGLRALLLGAAVLLSPAVLLAIDRANNDLVIFILLTAGLLPLRDSAWPRIAWFALMTLLATGLKFYPIAVAPALLLLRPRQRMLAATCGLIVAGVALLASLWSDLQHATILTPINAYTFGAPIVFRDLGWTGPGALLTGGVLLALAAVFCHGRGWSVNLDGPPASLDRRLAFASGALLLAGCFVTGVSFAYRLIFVIFLLPWLWERRATVPARVLVCLLLLVLWLDGIYCVAANTMVGPMLVSRLKYYQMIWRFCTQPVVWAAMALLAGSLLGMLLTAGREFRHRSSPS